MMETDKSKTKFRHYGHDQRPEDDGVCFVKTTGAMHNITFAICRTFASTYCVHVAEKRFHALKKTVVKRTIKLHGQKLSLVDSRALFLFNQGYSRPNARPTNQPTDVTEIS